MFVVRSCMAIKQCTVLYMAILYTTARLQSKSIAMPWSPHQCTVTRFAVGFSWMLALTAALAARVARSAPSLQPVELRRRHVLVPGPLSTHRQTHRMSPSPVRAHIL